MRLDTFLLALSTFFATIGPADLVLVFAALTEKFTTKERRVMALRGTLIATGILIFFAGRLRIYFRDAVKYTCRLRTRLKTKPQSFTLF